MAGALIVSDRAVPIEPNEDSELTAFLHAQMEAILSASHEPRPRCPRCGGGHITSAGFRTRPVGRLPMFECQTCQRYFSRTAGTPLGEKHLKKLDLFVSLLSQPLSYRHAGEQMGSLSSDIGERVRVWRAWLLQLDPSGSWERSVRLGGRPTELASTPLAFDEIGAQEDQTLTARLTHEFDELNSRSRRPPQCRTVAADRRVLTSVRTGPSRIFAVRTTRPSSSGAAARGPQTDARPSRADWHRVRAALGHCVEPAAAGNGLRLRHRLLATTRRVAEGRCLATYPRNAAGGTAPPW